MPKGSGFERITCEQFFSLMERTGTEWFSVSIMAKKNRLTVQTILNRSRGEDATFHAVNMCGLTLVRLKRSDVDEHKRSDGATGT